MRQEKQNRFKTKTGPHLMYTRKKAEKKTKANKVQQKFLHELQLTHSLIYQSVLRCTVRCVYVIGAHLSFNNRINKLYLWLPVL